MSIMPFEDTLGWYPAEGQRHFRWNPFRDLGHAESEVERTNRIMADAFNREIGALGSSLPVEELGTQMDYNQSGDLALRYNTTGFNPEEIRVDLEANRLTVTGRHTERRDGKTSERFFSRSITLDQDLDQSQIKCNMDENGELCISLPRHQTIGQGQQQVPIQQQQSVQ